MRKDIVYYIAGPMTGYPAFNIPLFDTVATKLRADGYTVVSPAELDDPEVRAIQLESPDGDPSLYEERAGKTWGDFLARDVKLIADEVGGIVLLPGWDQSRGARLEAFVGLLCGHEFATWQPWSDCLMRRPSRWVAWMHRDALRRAEENA